MIARPLKKARSVNSSSANFPTWVTTELDPQYTDAGTAAGRALIQLGVGLGGYVPDCIELFPYSTGADNDTFSMQVVGYRRITPQLADERFQYLRFLIAKFNCTISASVGLAGGSVVATERFADTIAIVLEGTSTADVTRSGSFRLYSPANDSPAHVVLPTLGCDAIELEFDQTLNTPAMNCLYSLFDDED